MTCIRCYATGGSFVKTDDGWVCLAHVTLAQLAEQSTPAQTYAARFAAWRARMPRQMRDDGTAYWLRQLHASPHQRLRRSGTADTAERGMGSTRFERASTAAYGRMMAAGHRA